MSIPSAGPAAANAPVTATAASAPREPDIPGSYALPGNGPPQHGKDDPRLSDRQAGGARNRDRVEQAVGRPERDPEPRAPPDRRRLARQADGGPSRVAGQRRRLRSALADDRFRAVRRDRREHGHEVRPARRRGDLGGNEP